MMLLAGFSVKSKALHDSSHHEYEYWLINRIPISVIYKALLLYSGMFPCVFKAISQNLSIVFDFLLCGIVSAFKGWKRDWCFLGRPSVHNVETRWRHTLYMMLIDVALYWYPIPINLIWEVINEKIEQNPIMQAAWWLIALLWSAYVYNDS